MKRRLSSANRPSAIGYVRVSSKKQRDDGNSLDDQREAIIRHAVLSGLDLVEVFADGGISGGKGVDARPGLAAALAAIREGRASTLIVKHADRLARDSDLAGYLKIEVKKAGASLEIIDEAKDDPIRAAVDKMLAELERIRGSQRMKFVYASKKARGEWTGGVPFGYRVIAGKLERIVAEQPIIERISALRAEGKALRKIAASLNEERIPTRSGKLWNAVTVSAIIDRAHRDAPSVQETP
jgi:DNA invertase Pin-like site-specific DNA recombinase